MILATPVRRMFLIYFCVPRVLSSTSDVTHLGSGQPKCALPPDSEYPAIAEECITAVLLRPQCSDGEDAFDRQQSLTFKKMLVPWIYMPEMQWGKSFERRTLHLFFRSKLQF